MKKKVNIAKEVKRRARQSVGNPPPTKRVPDKRRKDRRNRDADYMAW